MSNIEACYSLNQLCGYTHESETDKLVPQFREYTGSVLIINGNGTLLHSPGEGLVATEGVLKLPGHVAEKVGHFDYVIFTPGEQTPEVQGGVLFARRITDQTPNPTK